jgi:hypothetical protein
MNTQLTTPFLFLFLLACSGNSGNKPTDLATTDIVDHASQVEDLADLDLVVPDVVGIAEVDVTLPPQSVTVGEDLDQHETRSFGSGYDLPQAWYDALVELGVDLELLFMPDIGLTADWDLSRLHWTDTIRHEGHKAPTFAYMVIEDIEKAVAQASPTTVARELLVAQQTFQSRDEFITSRYDEAVTVTPGERVLLEVLQAWYEHPPVDGHPEPPEKTWEQQEFKIADAVSKLPLPVQVALAQAVMSLTRAAELRNEALLSKELMTIADWSMQHDKLIKGGLLYDSSVLEYAHPGFDFEIMAQAGQLALRATESLRVALIEAQMVPVAGATVDLIGPLGRLVLDFTETENTWKYADGFLLVDAFGNDTYYGRVAANTTIYLPVSVILDLAGDDTYAPGSIWEYNADTLTGFRLPMQGAGLFGIAILDDAGGDDDYGCLTTCQGFGAFGVGVLLDQAGQDEYRGYDYAQGAAEFGYGLLLDRSDGNDSYETLQHSQGYGGPRGIGWLVDEAGNDNYLAIADPIIFDWAGEGTNFSGSQGFAFGWRGGPYWSGGLGGLFDLAGDDSYQCAVMCLGFGYFFGTGLFYDRQGDDSYVNTHKYTMGSATHQSVGLFIEGDGADTYTMTGDDEAIGLGYDHGVAYHLDRGNGDDVYTVENVGHFTLGFARHPAIGTLINEGGNDTYNIAGNGSRTCGQGWVDANDRQGELAKIISLALFMDLGGTEDVYNIEREEIQNAVSWPQTTPLGDGWNPDLDFAMGVDTE